MKRNNIRVFSLGRKLSAFSFQRKNFVKFMLTCAREREPPRIGWLTIWGTVACRSFQVNLAAREIYKKSCFSLTFCISVYILEVLHIEMTFSIKLFPKKKKNSSIYIYIFFFGKTSIIYSYI